jgi:cytochrome c-type biogenesis protein CcmH/NrfG
VQRRPASAAAWIILGDYLAAAAQPNEALGAYAHALDLDPALTGAEHAREALRVLG